VVGWLLVFPGQGVAVQGSPRSEEELCQMDQTHLSPKVVQVVESQVKTDRGLWEPEVNQMDSRFHQAEVQRVLGFRKTDLCRLDPVGWVEARVRE
jgi:hypothetical protein